MRDISFLTRVRELFGEGGLLTSFSHINVYMDISVLQKFGEPLDRRSPGEASKFCCWRDNRSAVFGSVLLLPKAFAYCLAVSC